MTMIMVARVARVARIARIARVALMVLNRVVRRAHPRSPDRILRRVCTCRGIHGIT